MDAPTNNTIQMPAIGRYTDVADYLKLSVKTIYQMNFDDEFPRGVYLGRGRFNMTRLADHITTQGSIIRQRRAA